MSDDAYVHDPADVDGERSEDDLNDRREPNDYRERREARNAADRPQDVDREFGWRGWVLVGWLVVALVVVPAYLFFYPRASETLALFGLGYRHTFLVVPLLPALILGALAVWATTRP